MTGLIGKGKGIGIILCIVLAMVMMVGLGINGLAYAASEVKVTVNGKLVQFPDQKPYIDANSRTLVPMRAPMEAMGVKVDWDADKRQATLDNNNTKVVFTIDQKVYQVNGKNKTMDTQAIIVSGRTCIPIRYAAQAFGATVSWDAPNRTAVITTAPAPGVTHPAAWGKLPTIPVEKGVRVSPPEDKNNLYSIGIDVEVPGAVDNGCAILANIMDDPSAGEKAKTIILNAKKDNLRAELHGEFNSGKYEISVGGIKSPYVYIKIWPLDS
ncbi:MAG: copper amine oxidase N-terminal domain-containing protein [Syntrophomonadaceae bacterium]|nr:copper amine oxidase N-terminal domain-containing protein [Syntrophomonadaceae bacterium]